MNRTTFRTRSTYGIALALALGAPVAACSSTTSSSTAASTSAPSTSAASSSTTAGGSSSAGSTGATTGRSSSSAAPVGCDAIAAEVPAVYATPVEKTEDVAGVCTLTLAFGDRVEALWNRNAANDASFATVATGQSPVAVPGAAKAVGGYDAQGARVTVLVDGKGTWQLSLTPEFTASRAADQADVDKLAALAAAIVARG
ncbi:MAG: hypothetical protein U0Q07_00305 [Acidimicrobiales bacterium]